VISGNRDHAAEMSGSRETSESRDHAAEIGEIVMFLVFLRVKLCQRTKK